MGLLLASLVVTVAGVACVVASLRLGRSTTLVAGFFVLLAAQLDAEALVVGGALAMLRPVPLGTAALAAGLAEVGWCLGFHRRDMARAAGQLWSAAAGATRRAWRHPLVLVLGLAVAVAYGWQLALGLALPPVAFASLSYHLVGPATWIQHGALVHADQSIFADTYPADQALASAWVGTFLGTLRLASATTLVFVAAGAAAVAALARGLGVGRARSALAALGFAAVPVVLLQAATAYVDVAAGATALAALCFALQAGSGAVGERGRPVGLVGHFLLAGCAAGLAAGTRSDELVIAAFVVVIGVARYLRLTTDDSGPRPSAALAALVVPVLVLAGTWYVRTWITWRSPFYPIAIVGFHGWGPVASVVVGRGLPAVIRHAPLGELGRIAASWAHDLSRHAYAADERLGGLGPQWLTFAVPALVVSAAVLARRRRDYLVDLYLPVVVAVLAAGVGWIGRYTIDLAGLGCVAIAYCLELLAHVASPLRRFSGLLATGFVATTGAGMWWATSPTGYELVTGAGPRVASIGQLASELTAAHPEQRVAPWPEYLVLDHLVPRGATIGFAGNDSPVLTYPLVGESLQRRLVRLGAASSGRGLARELARARAGFAVVSEGRSDRALGRSVHGDLGRYRPLTSGGAIDGYDLYLLGRWQVCARPRFTLTGATVVPHRSIAVTARLSASCGAEGDEPVGLWRGSGAGAARVAEQRTGADGTVTFVVERPPSTATYFIRQAGGYRDGRLLYPVATKPFTAEYFPIPASLQHVLASRTGP